MRRVPGLLLVALTLGAGGVWGCSGDQYVTSAPPQAAEEAKKWWAEKVDSLEPDFLAVLCDVSEVHRRSGTTATYVEVFTGVTMQDRYHYQLRLPVPLPDAALARAKARLAGWKPAGESPSYRFERRVPHWEGGEGCSDQKAQEIWEEAEKKYGWRG